MNRRTRTALQYAGGVAALAVVAALWLAFAPTRLGGSVDYAVIYGDSMSPGLRAGDLVVLHERSSYHVGDAVGYHNRELGRVVLHRIVGRVGGRYVFKGDNNGFLDDYHPTRSELIGQLWVRIPGAGRGLLWLRKPAHAGVVAALLVLVLLGGRTTEARRRRGRGVPPRLRAVDPVPETPARAGGGPPRRTVTTLAALAAGGLALFGLLAVFAYGRPTTRGVEALGAYTQQGAWSYSGRGAAGAVYPGGAVETGQTVFAHLVRRVRVEFAYRLASALPHAVSGSASLDARLTSMLGWSKPLPAVAAQSFSGDTVTLDTTLDMPSLERALADYYRATGVPSDNFNVVLTPQIDVHGAVGGRDVATSFAPTPLSFTLDAFSLRLSTPAPAGAPGAPPADPLHPSAPGSIERFVPDTVPVLGLGVPTARRAALVGLLVAALLGIAAVLLRLLRRGGEEDAGRFPREYADLIVPVQSAPRPPEGGYVDVADLDSLAHLAASYQRVILYRSDESGDSFFVDDDSSVYRYRRGGPEPAAPPVRTLATTPVIR
jgi:signal peptidase I